MKGPPLPPGEGRGEGNPRKGFRFRIRSPLKLPLTPTLSRRERGT